MTELSDDKPTEHHPVNMNLSSECSINLVALCFTKCFVAHITWPRSVYTRTTLQQNVGPSYLKVRSPSDQSNVSIISRYGHAQIKAVDADLEVGSESAIWVCYSHLTPLRHSSAVEYSLQLSRKVTNRDVAGIREM